jgi:hypothetical protein
VKFPQGLPPSTVAELTKSGVAFPAGTDPFQVVAVHPTQVYETVLMLAAFTWLWSKRDHAHAAGWLFGAWLVLAGVERFLIEFLRAKDDRILGDFTLAQATSVALVAIGAFLIGRWRDSAKSPAPACPVAPARTRRGELDQRDRGRDAGGPEGEHPANQAGLGERHAGQHPAFEQRQALSQVGNPLLELRVEQADAPLELGPQIHPQFGDALLQLRVEATEVDVEQLTDLGTIRRIDQVEPLHEFVGDLLAERVLEPFRQLHGDRQDPSRGSGLSLP